MTLPSKSRIVLDSAEQPVILFTSSWELEYTLKENPGVELRAAS
jgi:peptide subunit release factor RF-3